MFENVDGRMREYIISARPSAFSSSDHSALFLLNFNPQFDFIKVLDSLKDDRQMKNYYLPLQIDLDVANIDDRSGILVANIDDRSKF